MKSKNNFTVFLSVIHLCFVLSIVCFPVIYLSLGILALPALTSAFRTGKSIIYKEFDVYDSVSKNFFRGLRSEMCMMKYFPLQLIALLQGAGLYAAEKTGMDYLTAPILCCMAGVLTVLLYIIGCHVFYRERPPVTEAVIVMFYRVRYFLIVWVLMLLAVMFFGIKFAAVSVAAGAPVLFLAEAVVFLGVTAFRQLKGEITEEEKTLMGEDFFRKI